MAFQITYYGTRGWGGDAEYSSAPSLDAAISKARNKLKEHGKPAHALINEDGSAKTLAKVSFTWSKTISATNPGYRVSTRKFAGFDGSSRRKVTAFTHGGQTVTVYKDAEWGEYIVRLAGRPQADYHTDDKADAVATAKTMIGLSSTLHGFAGNVDVTRNFRRERKRSPSSCAAGSFRAKKTRNGTLLTFCCPKGKFNKRTGTCRVGMVAQSIGRPRRHRR